MVLHVVKKRRREGGASGEGPYAAILMAWSAVRPGMAAAPSGSVAARLRAPSEEPMLEDE